MSEIINLHHVEELPDGSTLQVISKEDTLEGLEFFVRLAKGGEYEDAPFEDYPQAYAHWRNVLRQLGITVAYVAPVVEFTDMSGPAPVRGATEIFFEFHSQLKHCGVGTEAATALRDKYIADTEFQEHALDIYELAQTSQDWVGATIRIACKRVMAHQKQEEKRSVEEHLVGLANFGAF